MSILFNRKRGLTKESSWLIGASSIVTIAACTGPARASGVGDLGEALHGVYWYGFVPVGLALPEYSMRLADGETLHGLQWEVPVLFGDELDGLTWGGGASFSWYPSPDDLMVRGTFRAVWLLRESDETWKTEVPGVGLGIGGFWHEAGFGPRLEVRARYWAWAGVYVSAAWEPMVSPSRSNGGELGAGLEVPLVL